MRYLLICLTLAVASCRTSFNETVKGNGDVTNETRDIGDFSRIKIEGSIDVELAPGTSSVKVEADRNLQRYIITKKEDGWLVIKTRDHVNLRSDHRVKVYVTAGMIEALRSTGSNNVTARGKFSGAKKMEIDIRGSGTVDLAVNTPQVIVDVMGSGEVILSGETKDADVDLDGSGSYNAERLLTESTAITISGSGDAKVHADVSLDAKVRGSGSIFYRGNAKVKGSALGSGTIKHIE